MPSESDVRSVFHITQRKSGSQWVRDVLASPEIAAITGIKRAPIGLNNEFRRPFQNEQAYLYAPIYGMSAIEWNAVKQPGEKAVVVLRDPRDVVVSLLYSTLYSHAALPRVQNEREILYSIIGKDLRLRYLIGQVWHSRDFYTSWVCYAVDDALIVRYENLIAEENQWFLRISRWLGWDVPEHLIVGLVERNSFERRSGRPRGETDVLSHYRRGVAGDWKIHFSRAIGELWETLYPGFLMSIGYETSQDWWSDLPDSQSADDLSLKTPEQERLAAQERRITILEKELEEKEAAIQGLARACAERLELIHRMDEALKRSFSEESRVGSRREEV
jgi:lipopolysaccharide transport system ATP-binding protein